MYYCDGKRPEQVAVIVRTLRCSFCLFMRNLPTKYLLKFDETSQTCHLSSSLIFRKKNFFFLSEGIVHVDDDVLKTKNSQMLKYRIPNKKKRFLSDCFKRQNWG